MSGREPRTSQNRRTPHTAHRTSCTTHRTPHIRHRTLHTRWHTAHCTFGGTPHTTLWTPHTAHRTHAHSMAHRTPHRTPTHRAPTHRTPTHRTPHTNAPHTNTAHQHRTALHTRWHTAHCTLGCTPNIAHCTRTLRHLCFVYVWNSWSCVTQELQNPGCVQSSRPEKPASTGRRASFHHGLEA